MIYFTSDLHLNHDKEFIWKARGFNSVDEMNNYIIDNWRATDNDDVYILGDLLLGELTDNSKELIKQLKGKLHIIRGNHDTNNKIEFYKSLPNVVEVVDALYLDHTRLKFFISAKKYHFYLSHYPTLVANTDDISGKKNLFNLFGHTHQNDKFFDNKYNMYNVGLDCHNCELISINELIDDLETKIKTLKEVNV